MTELFLKIEANHDEYDCDIKSEVVTIEDIINGSLSSQLERCGVIQIKTTKGGKISKETVKTLRKYGWVHLDSAKNREERKVLVQEFYIMNPQGSNYGTYDPKFEKINPDKLTDMQVTRLAGEARIVQKVSERSVLSSSQYKRIQTAKKAKELAENKRKAAKQKRLEAKKQKEIEAAENLLKEAGVI